MTSRSSDNRETPWTPGPLQVCIRPLQKLTVETAKGRVCVAEVFGTLTSDEINEEAEANARLIAAAPEMAAALERVPAAINGAFAAGSEECEGGSDRRQARYMASAERLCDEIRALLSRIYGEQSDGE